MKRTLALILLVVCLSITGCVAFLGKTIHRIRTKDDVVLVKKPTPVLYRRFVKKGRFVRSAPDSLLARKTGWLTPLNEKIRTKEVVVFGNLEQAEESGEQFEMDQTVLDWIKKHRSKKAKIMARRTERRDAERKKWGHVEESYAVYASSPY